jgi:hypothetical protein
MLMIKFLVQPIIKFLVQPVARRASLNAALALLLCALLAFSQSAAAARQKSKKGTSPAAQSSSTAPAVPTLTRTTIRHEVRRFAYGGTLTILGAPAGSITIEGWSRNEVDITAEIELHADAEEDFARLGVINGFLLDEDVNHLSILTTGMHDKAFMRRAAKDFPKRLLSLPWKIDYRVRLPLYTDLEIDAGRGPITLNGVEGAIRLNALASDATLAFTGGTVSATIGSGTVNLNIAARSWRGAGADIRLASGDLIIQLPPNFNADINADILRTGSIENAVATLLPRERTNPGPRSIKARAGAGGATLSFTVGDGTLRLKQSSP